MPRRALRPEKEDEAFPNGIVELGTIYRCLIRYTDDLRSWGVCWGAARGRSGEVALHGLQSGCSVGEANPSEARWRRPRTWCVLKFVPGLSHNPMQAGPRRGVERRFVSAGG